MNFLLFIVLGFLSCFLTIKNTMIIFLILFFLFHDNKRSIFLIIGMVIYCLCFEMMAFVRNIIIINTFLLSKEIIKKALKVQNLKVTPLIMVSLLFVLPVFVLMEEIDIYIIDFLNILLIIGIVYGVYWCIMLIMRKRKVVNR